MDYQPEALTQQAARLERIRPWRQMAGLAAACGVGFAFSANYTNHAPVVPALVEDFHFSRTLAGLLTTGIFLTHAGMQIPGGHLADRFGATRVLMAALALVCVGNFAIGFASAYWQLLFWKIFVGLGTGTCFVAGARYITGLFEGKQLHMAQGLYGGSVLLGSGFVIFAVPQFLTAFGWRGAFFATATFAAVAWFGWLIAATPLAAVPKLPGSLGGMLSNSQLWLLGFVQMASFGLAIVVGAWISALLRQALGISPAQAGLVGSVVLLLGIVTRPLGGGLVPKMGVRLLLQISLLLSAAGCLWLGLGIRSLLPAAAAVVLLGFGCGLPYAGLFNHAAALYPGRAGAAMGLVNMLGIVMILVGAPVIGYLADWTGNFQSGFLALSAFTLIVLATTFGIKKT
jgi:nitrate/nitrite transporter NarK